ncbi:MAG TPA: hypothetical protein VI320_19880 [Terracidiphilus sp.]
MYKTIPQDTVPQETGPVPPNQQPPVGARHYHSDRNIVFAIGVVLLVFGPAITGCHQASMIGLALIVFCNLI